jgi:hypothetical protein
MSIYSNLFLYLIKKLKKNIVLEVYYHLLIGLVQLNWRKFLFFKELMDYCLLDPGYGIRNLGKS